MTIRLLKGQRAVTCDAPRCEAQLDTDAGHFGAREEAKDQGWFKVADVKGAICDLCPKCAELLAKGLISGVKRIK